MKFYVFRISQDQVQAINCDNFILAVLNHKRRANAGDARAREWLESLAGAVPIEAEDAVEAKEIYEASRTI